MKKIILIGLLALYAKADLIDGDMCNYWSNKVKDENTRLQKASKHNIRSQMITSIRMVGYYLDKMIIECPEDSSYYKIAVRTKKTMKEASKND